LIYRTRSCLKGGHKLPPTRVVVANHYEKKDTRLKLRDELQQKEVTYVGPNVIQLNLGKR